MASINEAIKYANDRYTSDEDGNIFNIRNGRQVKPYAKKNPGSRIPYLHFSVNVPGSKTVTKVPVHRFIAYKKFGDIILQPDVLTRHMDSNYLNNRPDNLTHGSYHDNMMDQSPEIRLAKSCKAAAAQRKLTYDQAEEIRKLVIEKVPYKEIMERFKIGISTISDIKNNKIYTAEKRLAAMKPVLV